jgi:beta-lactamase regulating signal transducer with metallopeptidase domain
MEGIFIKLLNMSITASWLILAVVLLRVILKKAPKSIRRILWALVGIRLIVPFSPESLLSLIPSAETVSLHILYTETPEIHSGITAFNTYINPVISESLAPTSNASINPMQVALIASIVWIAGMMALLLYAAVNYIHLRRRVAEAVPLRDNLWQSEVVTSPFVLGFFRPRIYLPFGIEEESMAFVVTHENEHISHRDHWIKPIGFLLLVIYWFNPLIWLAYVLLCRDIELACDERVVRQMSVDYKKAYSKALLTCSISRRSIAACPLAFGEVGVKQRIKNVLNYKKPEFWVIVAALASCAVVAVCFLTNPKDDELNALEPFGHCYRVESIIYEDTIYSFTYTPDNAPRYYLTADYVLMEKTARESDWISLGGLQEKHLSPLVFDDYFREADTTAGWLATPYCPEKLRLDNKTAWRLIVDDMLYYVLLQNNGDAYLAYGYYDATAEYPSSKGSIRWLFKLSVADEEVSSGIAETTSYISQSCIYMNPLSSTLSDGDSGCRYYIGEDSAAIMNKQTGDFIAISPSVSWDWQPISGDDWQALFPLAFEAPDIGIYKNPQVMKLSSKYYLFNMDGELWIGQYNSDEVGMWSVYSLARESNAGVN